MVLLDRGPDVDSSAGLPDKGLEETFHDHLCSRPPAVHLLDVRWRYQLINLCLVFYLKGGTMASLLMYSYSPAGQAVRVRVLAGDNVSSSRARRLTLTVPLSNPSA